MRTKLIIMSLLSIIGINASAGNGKVKYLSYSYHGSIGGGSHTITVEKTNDTTPATITLDYMDHRDYGKLTGKVSDAFMDSINALCEKYQIHKWDGFDKINREVLDGYGFSLSAKYENNKHINAHGSNSFPAGYHQFSSELEELIKPEKERLFEEARKKKIERGVEGNLHFMMINFIQHGDSGYDRYECMISEPQDDRSNISVTVNSENGDFFPQGRHNYYGTATNEEIGWDDFAAIIKKYKIVNWMDYSKTAEDYNNAEWFQLDFSFEKGYISAMGSIPPDANYDAFRHDLLKQLAMMINKLVKKGTVTKS